MATNAPFTDAEGSQQLVLKEKRKALLKKALHCIEALCTHKLSNTFNRAH